MSWTTVRDLESEVTRHWKRGRLLSAELSSEAFYPLRLQLKRPSSRELSLCFDEVRHWIRDLERGSRDTRGFGYQISWSEINHRELGRNRVPASVFVPSSEDALRLIGKSREAQRFRQLAAQTLTEFPELEAWLIRRPMVVLEQSENWPRILWVLRWFRANPRPGLYVRQLEIPEVDSKFIGNHRGMLTELLDLVMPESALDLEARGIRVFEQRFGLRAKPALVRFRLLDERAHIGGLTDLTVPVAELARLQLPARRVFVTENDVNGLAFPAFPESLVVFGLGYGVDLLFQVPWLLDLKMHYWGDIDTHGFAMLNRLRTVYPHAQSLLMDREILLSHKSLWVTEQKPHRGQLPNLTKDEQALYKDLQGDRLGHQVRLEQERVAYTHVKNALSALV